MRILPPLIACLTLTWSMVTHTPLYGSVDEIDEAPSFKSLTINGEAAFNMLNRGALTPSYDLPSHSNDPLIFKGFTTRMLGSKTNFLITCENKDGHISVRTYPLEDKISWCGASPFDVHYDQLLNPRLTKEPLFYNRTPIQRHSHKSINITSRNEKIERAIYSSNGPINMESETFDFHEVLMRTPTGVYLAPHPDLASSLITGINLFPRIFYYTCKGQTYQSRTMCLNGTVDFPQGECDLAAYDADTIEISFSKSLTSFLQKESLSYHGLNLAPTLTREEKAEILYDLALAYRDGKDGRPQDPLTAQAMFSHYLDLFINPYGPPYPDRYGKAFHNLGLLAYKRGDFSKAKAFFDVPANLGMTQSKRILLKMCIDENIPATVTERFFALCDFYGYAFPLPRETFSFSMNAAQSNFQNTGDVSGMGACFKTLNNMAPGVVYSPVVWILEPGGLSGDGAFQTQLLVVGTQRIIPRA